MASTAFVAQAAPQRAEAGLLPSGRGHLRPAAPATRLSAGPDASAFQRRGATLAAGLGPVLLLRALRRRQRRQRALSAAARRAAPWNKKKKQEEQPAAEGKSTSSKDEAAPSEASETPEPEEEKPAAKVAEEAPLKEEPKVEEKKEEGKKEGKEETAAVSEGKAKEAAPEKLVIEPSVWAQVGDVAVLRPPPWVPTRAVVHFMGGAFVSAAPQWAYRSFLSALSARGIWVVAVPVPTSFDHLQLVSEASKSFETAYDKLVDQGLLDKSLPVYGVGHSMGALLTALTGCGAGVPESYSKRLSGQVFISYNSQSLAGAVPGWKELWTREEFRPSIGDFAERLESASGIEGAAELVLDGAGKAAKLVGLEGGAVLLGDRERVRELYAPALSQLPPLFRDVAKGVDDFSPGSAEVQELISKDYPTKMPTLLLKFKGDPIDQTPVLQKALQGRKEQAEVKSKELQGAHVSPNYNEPPDVLDGTDAVVRAALGSEMPLDPVLRAAGANLSALVEAVAEFVAPAEKSTGAPSGPSTIPRDSKKLLKELSANDFRHPLDRRQTRALERVPGLSALVRRTVTLAETAFYQDNVSTSVLVSEKQYSWLHELVCDACTILNVPKEQWPEVFIKQNPVPNAYTLAAQGKRPFVVVHTSLLELCSREEVQAVVAHELGHLKCEHGVWLSAANILLLGASALPLPARVLGPLLQRIQGELGTWSRAAELTCDRAALLVTQEPWTVLSVLVKLSGGGAGCKDVLPREELQAFLSQAERYDESKAKATPLEAMIAEALNGGRPRTHPIPVLRARELRRWADSEQLSLLLKKGTPMGTEQKP